MPTPSPSRELSVEATSSAAPDEVAQETSESDESSSAENSAPRAAEIAASLNESHILPAGSRRNRRAAAHAALLADVENLSGFYAGFATGLEKVRAPTAIHRDNLPEEPKTWKQMLKHPYSEGFQLAAVKEYKDLERRGTWKVVPRATAEPHQVLPLTWVFKYKFDTDGYLTKYKARLCVRGDLQTTDEETYAATLAARTFRALMAIAAAFDLEIRQYDAVNAFTNSELTESIYCH